MRDFYKFAEKAIETAGEAGRRKRKHAITLEQMGAKSRMAELERTQTGLTRRQGMIEAGTEARHKREYAAPALGTPRGGFRYAELAAKKRTGGAKGGFTSSQMANLRKGAYGQAQVQYQAMEESGAFGDKKYSVDERNKLIDGMASDLVDKYTSGGLPQAGVPEADVPKPQGKGWLTTVGGRRFDVTQGGMGYEETTPRGGMIGAGRGGEMPRSFRGTGTTGSWPSSRLDQALADPDAYYGRLPRRNRYLSY